LSGREKSDILESIFERGKERQEIKEKVMSLDGIPEVNVLFVWDPPWSVDRMSPVVKKELGFE